MEGKTWTLTGLVFWICRFHMIPGSASFPALTIEKCELLEHGNITCFWMPVSWESTSYRLTVNMTRCSNGTSYKLMGSCNTTHSQCSVSIGSVSHCFCVDVLATSPSGTIRSVRHCLLGINEVKMYPPWITRLDTIPEKAHCLKLEWTEDTSIYLQSERDYHVLQIEYRNPNQTLFGTVSAALQNWQMELCGLYPGTKHYVKIRAQDKRAPKHWSSWSSVREATTAEAAPGAAPETWRHIQPVDEKGQRYITLLWKPLQWPDSNGVILHYTVLCWSDLDRSHWDCGQLNSSNLSCVLSVSAHPCTCNLTASNSAGSSPPALIHIPGKGETVIPPPEDISIIPLDDFQLKVEWTVAVDQSETSFVVEWFPIPDNTANGLFWKILNGSSRSFIITEGVRPKVPYNVSVQCFYQKAVGTARFAIAFTRQGAPSVGPTLEVPQKTSNSLSLRWKAVPLEKLCGFIQNYTILYKTNNKVESLVLGGNLEQYSLTGLSAGVYTICVKAYTVAGGAAGPWLTVTVDDDNTQLIAILLCAVGTLLILVILLSQVERIQQSLCPAVPDPSKSSLSTWPPVSCSQCKLTILEIRQSPSLFDRIYVGGKTANRDRCHQDHSPTSAFGYQPVPTKSVSHESKSHAISHRLILATSDWREPEQTLNELNDEEFSGDLTAGCKSKTVTQPQSSLQIPISCSFLSLSESYLGMDVGQQSLTVPEFLPEVNAVNLINKRNLKARLEPSCFDHISTSCLTLPLSDSSVRVEAKDSTNLINNSNLFSGLESFCYANISATYLSVPEPTVAFADFVMDAVDTSKNLHQSRLTSKQASYCNTCGLSSYETVHVSHADFRKEAFESSKSQQVCPASSMHTDLKVVDTYRLLSPEECPFQAHSTVDSNDLLWA